MVIFDYQGKLTRSLSLRQDQAIRVLEDLTSTCATVNHNSDPMQPQEFPADCVYRLEEE